MKRLLIPLAAVLVLGGFLAWWFSPAQVVKRRVSSLMSTMTLSEGGAPAVKQAGAFSLDKLISKKLTIEAPGVEEANGTLDRSEVTQGFSSLAANAKFTTFNIKEFQSVTIDGDQANVVAKVECVVALSDYRPLDGLYSIEMDWQNESDGWRLTRAKWTESR